MMIIIKKNHGNKTEPDDDDDDDDDASPFIVRPWQVIPPIASYTQQTVSFLSDLPKRHPDYHLHLFHRSLCKMVWHQETKERPQNTL